ncbi:hypothetical protein [Rathayibacter rathayi]|uniref:hypothetical protein n=1 Tax=Rathayibacter rathayi TaxID=33887 RepID=UPI000CE79191|nr:hypothetical protein [Rathayibacter rathayi]PPF23579.1 hypothetical protein C5C34_08320 [Rathayibacter rathayi]PPG88544.1 hypothetical protein C5C47_07255 [Rathayibacter rathayi]PPG94843.1 hypothetical protein C5C22_07745 [Rathayibacter rathayi]PPG98865.1 hypothetical protein C5C00_02250 [Rathayibacter rathayi]
MASGDIYVTGQVVGNLIPLGSLAKLGKIGKAESFLGKVDKFGLVKPTAFITPSTTSALDWLKNRLGGGGVKVADEFTPTILKLDGVDGAGGKPRGVDGPEQKPRSGDEPGSVTPRGKAEVLDPFDPNRKGALRPDIIYRASAPGTNHQYMYETNADGL